MQCALRCSSRKVVCALLALAAGLGAFLLAQRALAIDEVDLQMGVALGPNWSAHGLTARLHVSRQDPALDLRIEEVRLAQLAEPIRALEVQCARLEMTADLIGCTGAHIKARIPGLGAQQFRADVSYGRSDESIIIVAQDLQIDGAKLALNLTLRDQQWKVAANLHAVPFKSLAALAKSFGLKVPVEISTGKITAELSASGSDVQLHGLTAHGALQELTLNNESGSLASEALSVGFDVRLQQRARQWHYELEISGKSGQAYAQPLFLDFTAHSLNLKSKGRVVSRTVDMHQFELDHTDVFAGSGSALLDFASAQPLKDLKLEMRSARFPNAYETYLQPLLLDTGLESMRTSGELSGEIVIGAGEPRSIDLRFNAVELDAAARSSVALRGLTGVWRWSGEDSNEREPKLISQLQWSGGTVLGLEFGASSMHFATQARDFRLLDSTTIPLLDGAIRLDSLRARNVGLPSVAFMIDAAIQPLSVQRLSKAFGWPEFGGQVSGSISKLRMREGVLSLGTTLEAQVFDGVVRVSDLRLEQPFGKWPRFYSNIDLRGLDLELLTSAFSFGLITGRLSGAIEGLELFAWSPVAFDAKLFTPADDRSRHRISQRAVENIGSIGGGGAGVSAALSSGFLRFFEDFNYSKLGISCRLRNEICEMNGVGPAPNGGYYLVQGRGLPRIDVIGNSRRVDWPRLVRQLIAATKSGGPVVD